MFADFWSANFWFAGFLSRDFRSAQYQSTDFCYADFRSVDFPFGPIFLYATIILCGRVYFIHRSREVTSMVFSYGKHGEKFDKLFENGLGSGLGANCQFIRYFETKHR